MIPRKTELLAPARDYDAGRAAVDFGADALYIGAPRFGARVAAGNSVDDIARLVAYGRRFGVRTYATLNTLIYEDELAAAEAQARELIAAGVDALIVQDMAYMRMGLSGVELHASTQTHNVTPEGVRFLDACGFSRVILERGLTLEQIHAIRAGSSVALEAFVHGAICVGYSGRCFLSRTMSPRSGNRGECAQPCRLPYDLTDAQGRVLAAGKHLLSLRDMDLSAHLAGLLDAGVDSFKIEGRLKDISYVKNTVAHYRRALDSAMAAAGGFGRASAGRSVYDFEPDPARTFSRGATAYFVGGKAPGVAEFTTPKATGVYIGRVARVAGGSFILDGGAGSGATGLAPGDGICFVAPCGAMLGTSVNAAEG
ncbi:MAG: U32 family peptidase, partial [Rikenellaceae bacterium]|nr:U32 family peptidase [Rikenellaceae bacterium]